MTEVDIDLLADYLGGVLDGTPEEARVAALIADDPGWRDAHDALSAGMTAVGAELGALGAATGPMPADVATRIDAALAHASRMQPPAGGAARDRHLVAVPGTVVGSTGSARDDATRARRRRRLRWAAPIAIAAGVLGMVGVGVDQLTGSGADMQAGTSASDTEGAVPMLGSAGPGLVDVPPGDRITASGIDYRRDTLRSRSARLTDDRVEREPAPAAGGPAEDATGAKSDGLARLRARDALLACLNAIAAAAGGGPITVTAVDYARFAGGPALIVAFSAVDGDWVWATGPDCGTPAGETAELDRVQVR